ncbi:MAG: Sir2 family NAD-dependent protein deacetylase [Spirochaetia bacterium]
MIWEIYYDNFGRARPNAAHLALARQEKAAGADGRGRLHVLITQNIDNLHTQTGSGGILVS